MLKTVRAFDRIVLATRKGKAADGNWHAWVWTAATGLIDLGRGGAYGINDGQIVGHTTNPDGTSSGTMATPTCHVVLRPLFWCAPNDGSQPTPSLENQGTCSSSVGGASSSGGGCGASAGSHTDGAFA